MTRINEFQYSGFFVEWLNETHNFDYEVVENNEEKSEIDAYATSKSNTFPNLNLQLVTSHGEVLKQSAMNTDSVMKGKDVIVGEVNIEEWISDVIKKKDKKYSMESRSNLILLIEGRIPTPSPQSIKGLDFSGYPFKGIYYVSLPVISSQETAATKNGFVIVIKDMLTRNDRKNLLGRD